jgi:tartrate-resistant acid phosphatase type 5
MRLYSRATGYHAVMPHRDLHFEPYVHLAGLTHDCALISWGGFFFSHEGQRQYKLLDDEEFEDAGLGRTESIGERSEPYGRAEVRAFDEHGHVAARAETTSANHVWLEGLEPNTAYRYEILVDGRDWLAGERYDWIGPRGQRRLQPSGRKYSCRFRTHPAADDFVPLAFAVLGDFGIGIFSDYDDSLRQLHVADALAHAVSSHDVRLVLTTGDNIYLSHEDEHATGAEDDDWFFSFYQPYRYVLDRVPFYPAVGNHDGAETENSDDRSQLDDNYFLRQRFTHERDASRASVEPGLFYRFEFGATASFVCIDTTKGDDTDEKRYFDDASHERFLRESFPEASADRRWRIPYSHHPVYCAGPEHGDTEGMLRTLVPLFKRSGVQLVLAGHEHNFQYSREGDQHYIVSGAGGKLRPDRPTRFREARTVAWAAQGHFLIVTLDAERAVVHVLTPGRDGMPEPLVAETPDGKPFQTPIVIERT